MPRGAVLQGCTDSRNESKLETILFQPGEELGKNGITGLGKGTAFPCPDAGLIRRKAPSRSRPGATRHDRMAPKLFLTSKIKGRAPVKGLGLFQVLEFLCPQEAEIRFTLPQEPAGSGCPEAERPQSRRDFPPWRHRRRPARFRPWWRRAGGCLQRSGRTRG